LLLDPQVSRARAGDPATGAGAGVQPLGMELLFELGVEVGELAGGRTGDPSEDAVGERRVPGQHRTVQVRAEEAVAEHSVGARSIAVPAAGEHLAEGLDTLAERGATAVVLEARDGRRRTARSPGRSRRRLDHDLADEPGGSGARDDVDEPRAFDGAAVGCVVTVPEELEARAHGDDHRSTRARVLDRRA
jgi:hypothetical protein